MTWNQYSLTNKPSSLALFDRTPSSSVKSGDNNRRKKKKKEEEEEAEEEEESKRRRRRKTNEWKQKKKKTAEMIDNAAPWNVNTESSLLLHVFTIVSFVFLFLLLFFSSFFCQFHSQLRMAGSSNMKRLRMMVGRKPWRKPVIAGLLSSHDLRNGSDFSNSCSDVNACTKPMGVK